MWNAIMVVVKNWKKIFYHCFCQTLVLVNRTLLSWQLCKEMRSKLNWHIIKVKRREDLRNLSGDKKCFNPYLFFLEFCFNVAIVKYIFHFITKNTQTFSQINGLSHQERAKKPTHTTYITPNLKRKPLSFSFTYFRAGTSSIFISLGTIT